MTTTTEAPMLRWSSVRDCARKAVYEATGAPARDRYDREERILFRGKTIGRDYADMLAAQHGADAIERERKVLWPLGVGHIDVFVKETKTVIEVLSSAHASDSMIRSKLVQAVGYCVNDPDAENVCLVILNPSDYSEERVVVTPSSPQWDDLVDEVNDRIEQVMIWRDEGKMPERVCRKPGDAHGHFCLHAEHCFQDWTPPETPVYDGDLEAAQMLAIRLAHLKAKKRELAQATKLIDGEQKKVQEEFSTVFDYGEQRVGGYKVKRSQRSTKSFKVGLAELDSRLPVELLQEFTNVTPWDAWEVEKVGDAETVDDETAPF